MKTLFLARHADAGWPHPQLSDHDRPLNRRGQQDAPRVAARLAAGYPPPALIVSSTATRARSTAGVLGEALGHAASAIAYLPALYLADTTTLLAAVHQLDDRHDSAMLVGHNPGMTEFINLLCDAGLGSLSTCGVARVGLDVTHWRDVAPGGGRLLSLDRPAPAHDGP